MWAVVYITNAFSLLWPTGLGLPGRRSSRDEQPGDNGVTGQAGGQAVGRVVMTNN